MIGNSGLKLLLLVANASMVLLAGFFLLLPLPEPPIASNQRPGPVSSAPAERPSEAPAFASRSFFRSSVPEAPAPPAVEPASSPTPTPVEPQEASQTLRLVGVIDHGAASIAFVLIEGLQGIQRRVLGEEIDGWILERIGRRSIELRRGQETTLLTLDPKVEP